MRQVYRCPDSTMKTGTCQTLGYMVYCWYGNNYSQDNRVSHCCNDLVLVDICHRLFLKTFMWIVWHVDPVYRKHRAFTKELKRLQEESALLDEWQARLDAIERKSA